MQRKRPPRAFQFTIWRLLVATTVCAVLLAVDRTKLIGATPWVVLAMVVFVILFADWNALHDLNEAIRVNPDGWEAYDLRGQAHLATRDFARALEDFDTAIQQNPEHGRAQVGRAIALFKLGEHDTALREIADAAAAGPCDASALCAHAWFLATCPDARLRDGRRAHELAEAARGLETADPWIWEAALAAAYAELGSFSQAADHAQKALDACPPVRREEFAARLAAYEARRPWRDDGTRQRDAPRPDG